MYSIGSFPLTSSPSMSLTYLLFSIAPLAVAPPLTSPLLSPLSPYLAPGKCFKTWSPITYQLYLPSLFVVFHLNERFYSSNFQKARCDDFTFYFDSQCSSAEEYSSLSFAAVLFTSLTPNALLMIWCFGQTAVFLFLLARAALALLPTTLFVALRPLFSFQQAQFAEIFPLKLAPSCKLFAGVGSTNKISSLLLSSSHSVLFFIFPFTAISLWQIW